MTAVKMAHKLTAPKQGAVWGLVLLGHWLVVWGLLWVKVPALPSTSVAPIQVEWIELANLATASDQSQSSASLAMGDMPKPKVANPPNQQVEKIVKPNTTPKIEPKTEPKPKTKQTPNTEPNAKLPILTNNTPNTNSWTAEVQNEPQNIPKDEPKLEPKLKDEPKNEPKSQPNTANDPPVKDNGKQGDDKANDKASDKTNEKAEPKGDRQGIDKGNDKADKGNGNANAKQGEKDGKSSAQTPSHGNNSHSNTGTSNSPNPAKSNALEQSWSAKVRAKIERSLDYPDEALSKKWSGKPTLKITIDKAGNVLSVSIEKSSGKAILDDEAIATARRASPLPAPPDEIMDGQASKSFRIPVRFDLKKHQ